ncbi:MAG: hypothetical protein R2867_20090 [Caldilineaceae bacterium]
MKEVRIAIVGMGIGRANAGGFMRTPRARVTALCDIFEERMVEAESALGLVGAKHYTSYEDVCVTRKSTPFLSACPTNFMCR